MATTARIEVKDKDPVKAVQEFLKTILSDEEISAVLVPCHLGTNGASKGVVMPTLVTDPDQLDLADPFSPAFPLSAARLAARLTRGEVEGQVAAVLRPCEIRAFIELIKLNQGSMENLLLIGLDCYGAMSNSDFQKYVNGSPERGGFGDSLAFIEQVRSGGQANGIGPARACKACEHPSPDGADLGIGLFGMDLEKEMLLRSNSPKGEGALNRVGLPEADRNNPRHEALERLVKERIEYRDQMFKETAEATKDMTALGEYLSGCVNCYNCRVACPVCFCKECVFVTDVFDHKPWQYLGWAKRQGALRLPTDTVFYHLTRMAHMSTACVGCGQCSNACPNDVPVMELFRLVGAKTQAAFEYQAGRSPDEAPPLAVFHEKEFSEVTGGID